MRKEHRIAIDSHQCIGCGLCVGDCPASNILIENKKARVIAQDCILCGHCVAICPKAAVSMTGFENPPQEIDQPARLNPEELLLAIRTRRSIRQFRRRPPDPQIIDQIIEAGRLMPTGGNAQDVSFVVLREEIDSCEEIAVKLFRRLLPLAKLLSPVARRTVVDDHFFFKGAPVAIVVASPDRVNGALAAANMELMAEACGLGVLYSGFFSMAANHSRALGRKLGLARGQRAVTTLVLGYAAVTYHRTAQKEAAQVRRM